MRGLRRGGHRVWHRGVRGQRLRRGGVVWIGRWSVRVGRGDMRRCCATGSYMRYPRVVGMDVRGVRQGGGSMLGCWVCVRRVHSRRGTGRNMCNCCVD